VREHGGQRWRKKSREVRAIHDPGESYSDVIIRLASEEDGSAK
jgi:hypothetical protein